MALIILQPNSTSSANLGSGSDKDIVFGAGGNETVRIDANGVVELDPSFNVGGDTIKINGNAGDYQAHISGSNIVLTNASGANISIPAGTAGANIVFLDAERELIIKSGKLCLGDQQIPLGGGTVDVTDGDVNHAPAFGDDDVTINATAGEAFSDTLLGAAVDPDGDSLAYSLKTAPLNGSAVVNANGTYTYTPASGFTGNDQYVVQVSDGDLTDTIVVNVVVAPAGGGSVSTTSLKVSQDNLVGTTADDTFRARVVQNNDGFQTNTLGSGDSIDGRAGASDTLDAWVQDASPLGSGPGSSILPETTSVEYAHFRALSVANLLDGINVEDLPQLFTDVIKDFIPFLDLDLIYGPRTGVEINASDMFGLKEIGSVRSDDSLTVYNLTTLASDGETVRNTEAVAIIMDHTGNNNAIDPESDLTELFDRDYLLCDAPITTGATLEFEMMDLDAAILLQSGAVALGGLYPATFQSATNTLPDNKTVDGPLDEIPYSTLSIDVGGNVAELSLLDAGGNYPVNYIQLLNNLKASLAANPFTNGVFDGTVVTADFNGQFTANDTDVNPGGSAQGSKILLTNTTTDSLLTNAEFLADRDVPGDKDYHLEVREGLGIPEDCKITVNITLEKVGRGGDGGELTVGGMTPDLVNFLDQDSLDGIAELPRGVEQFNVYVVGTADQPSSLANLRSTDNTLRCIIIKDEGDSEASLTIGNRNTNYSDGFFDSLVDGIDNVLGNIPIIGDLDLDDCNVSSVKNNAIKDVLVFDASAFDNDTEIHAFFSDETVAKYLDLTDTADNEAADDQVAMYNFGNGNNILNVNISQTNMAVEGSITRGDFIFSAATTGGDDLIQIQLGNGQGSLDYTTTEEPNGVIEQFDGVAIAQDWYHNHVINGYKQGVQSNLLIDAGSGNDKVETWGSTAAYVQLGSGRDVYFADNSGYDTNDGQMRYNCSRATWVFNTLSSLEANGGYEYEDDIDDLASARAAQVPGVSFKLTVSFQNIEVTVVVGSATGNVVNDTHIVQAIKNAINNDPVLSELLVAEDGPGRTLVVRSLIDGEMMDGDSRLGFDDLVVSLSANTAPGTTTIGTLTATQTTALALLGFTATGAPITADVFSVTDPDVLVQSARFRSEFASDGNGGGDDLDGEDSATSTITALRAEPKTTLSCFLRTESVTMTA